jgi:hypothetical protein
MERPDGRFLDRSVRSPGVARYHDVEGNGAGRFG